MPTQIITKQKPTGAPFEPSERAGFELLWASQKPGSRSLQIHGEANPLPLEALIRGDALCFVRHLGKPFVEEFHSRKGRAGGKWVGDLHGWIFPFKNSQKVADLVDQVGAYLKSLEPESAQAKPAATPRMQQRTRPLRFGEVAAVFTPKKLGDLTPLLSIASPYDDQLVSVMREAGGRFSQKEKQWGFNTAPIVLSARRALASMLRGHLALRREGRAIGEAIDREGAQAFLPDLPAGLENLCREKIVRDASGGGFWIATTGRRNLALDFSRPVAFFHKTMVEIFDLFLDREGNLRPETLDSCAWARPSVAPGLLEQAPWRGGPRLPQSAATAQNVNLLRDDAQKREIQARKRWIKDNPELVAFPEHNLDALAPNHNLLPLALSIELARAVFQELSGNPQTVRLRDVNESPNDAAAHAGRPSCVGEPKAGTLFFSEDQFWLSLGGAVREDGPKHSRTQCLRASPALARAWLSAAEISNGEELLKKIRGSQAGALSAAVLFARVSAGLFSPQNAADRCEALSGLPAGQAMACVERAEILSAVNESVASAQAQAEARGEASVKKAARGPQRL